MSPTRPTGRKPGWGDGSWPPPSTPIAVEGGLQARSLRGPIGETWWSQRFIAVLESVGVGGRLQRGKRYARTGQVLSMDITPGQVTASVQGSRTRPYRVYLETRVLTPAEWTAAEAVMASSAVFMAKLLAGDMPEQIEEAFAGSSRPLFPDDADEFDSACSCPDWENPCKHVAAVYFLLAEAFDRDPFLIFAWRGRHKAELLDALRARRHGVPSQEEPDTIEEAPVSATEHFGWPPPPSDGPGRRPGDPESLWGRAEDLATIEVRPRLAVAPDLILRQLDPAALAENEEQVLASLPPLYDAITAGAAVLALGEPSGPRRESGQDFVDELGGRGVAAEIESADAVGRRPQGGRPDGPGRHR
jgi:uncharacterized Zn finger protein